jgi:NADH dehydrogenase [ubiquinone] 1 alpha subcomplex assembly factor 7
MPGVADDLRRLIVQQGPISVAQYIEICNAHYYATRDPLGVAGDFTTAPEISQMFGELLGLWCLVQWRQMGAPDPIYVVEAGPGRGTLMADFLRAAGQDPAFIQALRLHLIETSPVLRSIQKETLHVEPVWCDRLDDVPEGPMLFVANEFFDALPIRQLERTTEGWCERLVGLDGDDFCFVVSDKTERGDYPDAEVGAVLEDCPIGIEIAQALGKRITSHGGGAVMIDYGYAKTEPADTLQAVKNHQYHSVLADPGDVDLTAHVNFERLSQALTEAGANVDIFLTQRNFLLTLGIDKRAEILSAEATPEQAEEINSALNRLIGADEMGTLFKVLVINNETTC